MSAVTHALSPEDVAESEAALRETFTRDPVDPSVCVVDGYGATVGVDGRHLVVADGFGPYRRTRRFALATHGLTRLVVVAGSGSLSLDAWRWAAGAGVGVVVLDPHDASVLATSGACLVDDPRLRRAQAFAAGSDLGLRIARYLIATKLAGERSVAGAELHDPDAAASIGRVASGLQDAASLEEVRQLEAVGANLYWRAWEEVAVRFARRDLPRVPEHWRRFDGRRSAVSPGSARHATDPANACLNYSYRLLEAEGRVATLALGIDPALGFLHADMRGRDSFVLDLIEAGRPVVERHIARMFASHTFRRRDFAEDRRGVLRVLAPATHNLTEAIPLYAKALAPVAEHVAGMLAEASAYGMSVPTHLSGAKHKAAARLRVGRAGATAADPTADPTPDPDPEPGPAQYGPNPGGLPPRRKARQRPTALSDPRPLPVCEGCGEALPVPAGRVRTQRTWCHACLPERRGEIDPRMQAASLDHARAFAEATGVLPSHTPEAQAARSAANARQVAEQQAWSKREEKDTYAADLDAARSWYAEQVAPKLASLTLPAIARATGASTSAASKWRAGRTTPHPRRWSALAELVGAEAPTAKAVGQ